MTWNVGKHRMNALVGYSYQYYAYERFMPITIISPTDFYQWHNLGLGQALKDGKAGMGSDKNENTLIGFFARVSYAFDNKYNLLVSVRQEGGRPSSATITNGVLSLLHLWDGPSVMKDLWRALPG